MPFRTRLAAGLVSLLLLLAYPAAAFLPCEPVSPLRPPPATSPAESTHGSAIAAHPTDRAPKGPAPGRAHTGHEPHRMGGNHAGEGTHGMGGDHAGHRTHGMGGDHAGHARVPRALASHRDSPAADAASGSPGQAMASPVRRATPLTSRLAYVPKCRCGCGETRSTLAGPAGRLGAVVPGIALARLPEASPVRAADRVRIRLLAVFLGRDPIPI